MSKKCGAILPGWLSAYPDGKEKRFIQIGNSLLFSSNFQELSDGAKHLYQCCAMESGGRREFEFPLKAAKKYGLAEKSFRRHITELVNGGFIEFNSGANTRQPNKYSFSFQWKQIQN